MGLAALDHGPFRTFFAASLVSNSATFVLSAGLYWSVLELTGSAASVGFVGFLYALPFALFTLHAGLLTDRFGSRRLVALSLVGAGTGTVLLGALALGAAPGLTLFALLAFAIGCVSVLGSPGSISIVNDLVPREAVPSAVSLVFLDVNAGRIIGGLLAGLTLALWPSGTTLVLAGVLLVLPAVAIWRLPIADPEAPLHAGRSLVGPLRDAARYARRVPVLGVVLLLAIVPGAIGLSYNYLLPVATQELGYGSDGLGIMLAGAGAGGLLAGLVAERVMRLLGHGRAMFAGLATIAGGLMAFGVGSGLAWATITMLVAGAGFVIYAVSSLSLIQALSSAEFRGRLTALFALLYWGLMPIGALVGGALAEQIGAQQALLVSGAIVAAAGVAALVARPGIAAVRVTAEDHQRGSAAPAG